MYHIAKKKKESLIHILDLSSGQGGQLDTQYTYNECECKEMLTYENHGGKKTISSPTKKIFYMSPYQEQYNECKFLRWKFVGFDGTVRFSIPVVRTEEHLH